MSASAGQTVVLSHGRAALVDTAYLVALLDPRDALNHRAVRLAKALAAAKAALVCTDAVLTELANYFCRSPLRSHAIAWIDAIVSARGWEIVSVDRSLFLRGLGRYRRHLDKTWSLTDCTSMEVMQDRGLTDVATSDAGFSQGGFKVLLR